MRVAPLPRQLLDFMTTSIFYKFTKKNWKTRGHPTQNKTTLYTLIWSNIVENVTFARFSEVVLGVPKSYAPNPRTTSDLNRTFLCFCQNMVFHICLYSPCYFAVLILEIVVLDSFVRSSLGIAMLIRRYLQKITTLTWNSLENTKWPPTWIAIFLFLVKKLHFTISL